MNTAASYRYCHQLTRRAAKNFYPSFLALPRGQRRGMEALYAYLRLTDDLADEPGDPGEKRAALVSWREQLHAAAVGGPFAHPAHPALADTIRQWGLPIRYLELVIDGVESDLRAVRLHTFDELYAYCYRVASAVGLACIHIWGFRDPAALKFAEAAGVACQLTNILRDLGEDRANGRVFLPAAEWTVWGCPPDEWAAGNEKFRAFFRFQVDRARGYFMEGRRLGPLLTPAGRAVFSAIIGTYGDLLEEIARRDGNVFADRVRVPKWRKMTRLAAAFPRRWGWA